MHRVVNDERVSMTGRAATLNLIILYNTVFLDRWADSDWEREH